MKNFKMKSIDSYGEKQTIEFVYYDTTIICNITDRYCRVFKGVAKLHPDDTYDRIKGEQIAFDKACAKFNNTYQAIINNIEYNQTKRVDSAVKCMYAKVQKAQKNFMKKQNKLN